MDKSNIANPIGLHYGEESFLGYTQPVIFFLLQPVSNNVNDKYKFLYNVKLTGVMLFRHTARADKLNTKRAFLQPPICGTTTHLST